MTHPKPHLCDRDYLDLVEPGRIIIGAKAQPEPSSTAC
jgi:hypothetical protein